MAAGLLGARASVLRRHGHRTVVVAVVAVGVVQVPVHEVVHVVAMWHGLVSAAGAVHVTRVVRAAVVVGCALIRVLRADRQHMLVDVVTVGVMQVAIVQVVHVPVVLQRGVAAAGTVLVCVALMNLTVHFIPLLLLEVVRTPAGDQGR